MTAGPGGTNDIPVDAGGGEPPLPVELAELIEIADERRRLDAREARLLADASVGMACLVEFGHRVPQWLAAATRVSGAAARRRVRAADRLVAEFPDLLDALDAELVGWNHVEAFCRAANPRIAGALAELLPQLIDLAQAASFDRWCAELRGIAQLLDQDGGYDPTADPANSHLRLTPTMEGAIDVSGRLVGEMAWRISKLIEAETQRVLEQHREDLRAAHPEGEIPPTALPSHAQAAAVALGDLIERGAMTEDDRGQVVTPEIVVTYHADSGDLVDADTGEHLHRLDVARLLETAKVRPLLLSESGDPLRVGRSRRYASPTQRQALTVRDGGCIFPGCDRPPSWCDAHHVEHWEDGGGTDIENLALLCRHHHRVTHRPGWRMRTTAEVGRFEWETPSRRTLVSQRHQQVSPTAPLVGCPTGPSG